MLLERKSVHCRVEGIADHVMREASHFGHLRDVTHLFYVRWAHRVKMSSSVVVVVDMNVKPLVVMQIVLKH